ncbi:hypothetical protein ANCCAN_10794 [Ancylostoma caninum]|uniref:Uncharacterized protein n=1 Tax=Ancylostoma caninum TaxID=29170 RepID=A0A368GIY7_ANCCA|nr:hypothetical protein ANCCAN_10794 [Ancylostoma caninum]
MFEKFLLCLVIVIAIISFVSADFSCFFGDTICKSITCRKQVSSIMQIENELNKLFIYGLVYYPLKSLAADITPWQFLITRGNYN